jgi:hypothetical protein
MFMEENQQQEQEQVKVEPTVIVPVVAATPKKSFTDSIFRRMPISRHGKLMKKLRIRIINCGY